MEDILAIVLIFGGLAAFMLSISPVGRAIAHRIRSSGEAASKERFAEFRETQMAILEEMDQLRQEVTEVQERMDFAERLLAQREDVPRLPDDRGAAS